MVTLPTDEKHRRKIVAQASQFAVLNGVQWNLQLRDTLGTRLLSVVERCLPLGGR